MAYLNQWSGIGNLGRDPEKKQTNAGTAVVNFSVATTKRYTKDGDQKEITTWHNITCFDKVADLAEKYLKKGSQVFIQGELRTDTWDGEDGTKKYKTYIVADKIQFLSKLGEASERNEVSEQEPNFPKPPKAKKEVKNFAPGSDDFPNF